MEHNSWLLVRDAAKLNTAGVEALSSGHCEIAIQHLNNALVIINKLLLIHCDQYDLAARILNNDEKESLSRCRDDLSSRPTTREITALQDERFYIYNQALLFSSPQSCLAVTSEQPTFESIRARYIEVSFFWSIIHFNMALVLHKLIRESSENNDRYREEAILFYKLCLQNLWVIPASSPTMNLLMLCAVNNLAHVYLNLHCCGGEEASVPALVPAQSSGFSTTIEAAAAKAMALPFHQNELIQGLLLRAIGKVISNDQSLSHEQHEQVTEMSVNHIVISALSPSYVAAGA